MAIPAGAATSVALKGSRAMLMGVAALSEPFRASGPGRQSALGSQVRRGRIKGDGSPVTCRRGEEEWGVRATRGWVALRH
jgi:hypothetical protein